MISSLFQKTILKFSIVVFSVIPSFAFSAGENNVNDNQFSRPTVIHQIFDLAKKNENWKSAFLTAKEAQVVFMNVSPKTNPKNEIGLETHEFDQIILIAEGTAKTDLNGKTDTVKTGDMVFIPQGTPHNIINLSKDKSLKIVSIYTHTDIPAKAQLKTSTDKE